MLSMYALYNYFFSFIFIQYQLLTSFNHILHKFYASEDPALNNNLQRLPFYLLQFAFQASNTSYASCLSVCFMLKSNIQFEITTYPEYAEGIGPMKLQQPTIGKVLNPTQKRKMSLTQLFGTTNLVVLFLIE